MPRKINVVDLNKPDEPTNIIEEDTVNEEADLTTIKEEIKKEEEEEPKPKPKRKPSVKKIKQDNVIEEYKPEEEEKPIIVENDEPLVENIVKPSKEKEYITCPKCNKKMLKKVLDITMNKIAKGNQEKKYQ